MKKFVNVKYDPAVISSFGEQSLTNMIEELKSAVGDEFRLIFTPFDMQLLSDEEVFDHIDECTSYLKSQGREDLVKKIADLVAPVLNASENCCEWDGREESVEE